MKQFATLLLFSVLHFQCAFAQQKEIRLIVRGDDMGFSHAGNEALIKCYEEGIERSIEVLVPSPWFPEAVKMLEKHPRVDVGVHITLTTEWDNVKFRPLSDCPSLRDSSGYFYPMIWPNKNYPGQALLENKWNIADIEKEMRAQIELAKKKIPRISHISAHMGCYGMNEEVSKLARKLAVEYGLDIDPQDYHVKNIRYTGPSKTPAEKVTAMLKTLETLQPGETYLFVEHPCFDTPESRAIHHIGYENVAEDRQGVTDSWTDKRVLELVKKRGIKLISYADLKK
jgi:predicted glycoside hydrolase/deacetylase ChbG (UPF0249 family)